MAFQAFKNGEHLYWTKFGMTEGKVHRYTVAADSGIEESFVSITMPGSQNKQTDLSKGLCFSDIQAAIGHHRAQAARKILSLQAQINKLQSIVYTEHVVS